MTSSDLCMTIIYDNIYDKQKESENKIFFKLKNFISKF